mgnify:CR=1 FL=1
MINTFCLEMIMVQLCDIELILKRTQYFKFKTSIFDKAHISLAECAFTIYKYWENFEFNCKFWLKTKQNKLIPRQENTIPNQYWSILLSSAISNSRFTRFLHFKTDFTKIFAYQYNIIGLLHSTERTCIHGRPYAVFFLTESMF